MKEDVIRYVRRFEATGTFSSGCNSSFITLIPKVKDLISLGDYRPICLLGCLNMIMVKILANRIKEVIHLVLIKFSQHISKADTS